LGRRYLAAVRMSQVSQAADRTQRRRGGQGVGRGLAVPLHGLAQAREESGEGRARDEQIGQQLLMSNRSQCFCTKTRIDKAKTSERREFFPSPPREHVPTRRPWSRRGREDATLNETASGCGRPYGLSNFRRFAMRRTALGAAFLGTALGCGSLTRRGSTATGYQGGGGASKRPATTSVAQSGLSRSGARSGLEAKAARVADRIRAVELPRSGLVQRDAFAAAAGGPRLRGRPEADPEGMAACGQSLEGFAQMQCSVCLYGSVPSTII
jgi:hypothetical protein